MWATYLSSDSPTTAALKKPSDLRLLFWEVCIILSYKQPKQLQNLKRIKHHSDCQNVTHLSAQGCLGAQSWAVCRKLKVCIQNPGQKVQKSSWAAQEGLRKKQNYRPVACSSVFPPDSSSSGRERWPCSGGVDWQPGSLYPTDITQGGVCDWSSCRASWEDNSSLSQLLEENQSPVRRRARTLPLRRQSLTFYLKNMTSFQSDQQISPEDNTLTLLPSMLCFHP